MTRKTHWVAAACAAAAALSLAACGAQTNDNAGPDRGQLVDTPTVSGDDHARASDPFTEGAQLGVDPMARRATVDHECGQLSALLGIEEAAALLQADPNSDPATVARVEQIEIGAWLRTTTGDTPVSGPIIAAKQAAEANDIELLRTEAANARKACADSGSVVITSALPGEGG